MHAKLHAKDLWCQFAQIGNEMIVTKKGRNMFPHLQYSFSGLENEEMYQPSIQLVVYDERKYRFMNGRWDSFEPLPELTHYPREVFVGEPRSGADIMRKGVSFEKVKITNGDDVFDVDKEQIKLQTLRKYIPILSIYKLSKAHPMEPMIKIAQFRFEETQFIAVTAYQNMAVKDLKVLNNKYAHGFRENSQKRASTSPPSSSSSDTSSTTFSPAGGKRIKLSPSNFENIPLPQHTPIEPPTHQPYIHFPPVPMYPFDPMATPYFDPNFNPNVSPYFPPTYFQNSYQNYDYTTQTSSNIMNPWMGMTNY